MNSDALSVPRGINKPIGRPPLGFASSPSMWGLVEDFPYWQVVMKLYNEEKLSAAFELAIKLGAGLRASGVPWFRLVEAENEAEKRGTVRQINENISLQYVEEELGDGIESIIQVILEQTSWVARRFGWDGEELLLISLLPEDVDTSWATDRFGYCVRKEPYFKICIPHHAVVNFERFVQVLRHEYAHVVTLSLSHAKLPQWLGEGFSVVASGELSEESRRVFVMHPQAWLIPRRLETKFGRGVELGSQEKWLAYQQGGWIVQHLSSLKGEHELLQLMAAIGDESFLRNIKLGLQGRSRADQALRDLYGLDESRAFEQARAKLA